MNRTRVRFSLAALFMLIGAGPAAAQTMAGGAAPAAMAGFGGSLAVGAGEVLVGEPRNNLRPGTVYIYRRSGTQWSEAAQLRAPDARDGDGFGAALALDGGTLAVSGAGDSGGVVHVFQREGQDWRHVAAVVAEGVGEEDGFGASLSLSGDRLLVGAPGSTGSRRGGGEGRSGAVHAFRRDASGQWTYDGTLTAQGTSGADGFGTAVAWMGERALVGAPGLAERAGGVYVFRRDAAQWQQEALLSAQNAGANELLGVALGVAGERALVGAPGALNGTGAIYGFSRDGESGEWRADERLIAFDGMRGSGFGSALAFDGDRAFVGAPRAAGSSGAAYVFDGGEDGWSSSLRLTSSAVEPRDALGGSVAARGELAAAGALNADYGAGSVVIFERVDGEWTEAALVASPPETFPAVTGGEVRCSEEGSADRFDCSAVDLLAFLPVSEIGGSRGVRMNDVWGWTDSETNREYVLAGRMDGTAFVDVTDPGNPVYLGSLPKTEGSPGASWRDIKVYQDHAFIVADASGEHGMQVFDLTRLRDVENAPATFAPDTTYDRIHSAHNIVINEQTGFAFAVGSSSGGETCGGGLHMIDIRDPKNPTFAGCFADPQTGRQNTGYTHDAQCVEYTGPDEAHRGREICFGSNETALSIADVTDKQNPVSVARATYPNVGYSHQGWLTEDQRHFYMDDELDELQGSVARTRTLIWDVSDLDDPQLVGEFLGTTEASDHNLYVIGDTMYQSNYQAGLRIIDISDRENPREIGYFDTVPYGTNTPGFGGSWSNYPFFRSGTIAVTSGNEGLFLLKKRQRTVF